MSITRFAFDPMRNSSEITVKIGSATEGSWHGDMDGGVTCWVTDMNDY